MKRKRHEPNLKRNEIKTKRKRNYNDSTANLKRDETKRNACTLALTGYDAHALSVPVQRPGLTRRWAEGPAKFFKVRGLMRCCVAGFWCAVLDAALSLRCDAALSLRWRAN